jgi:hypothetical protein
LLASFRLPAAAAAACNEPLSHQLWRLANAQFKPPVLFDRMYSLCADTASFNFAATVAPDIVMCSPTAFAVLLCR